MKHFRTPILYYPSINSDMLVRRLTNVLIPTGIKYTTYRSTKKYIIPYRYIVFSIPNEELTFLKLAQPDIFDDIIEISFTDVMLGKKLINI